MKEKPKLLIGLCIFSLIIGSVFLVNSIRELNNAEKVADYLEPTIREDCSNLSYLEKSRCDLRVMKGLMKNTEKNVALRRQLESKASQNILFAILIIIFSIVGLYYFNFKYERGD